MEPVLASMIHRGIPATAQPQRSPWQRFLAPMLLASLGLHGLVLLVPTGASQEEVIPPADPEQDSVAITRVPPEDLVAPAPNTPLATGNAAPSPPGQPLPGQTAILRATLPAQRSTVESAVGSVNSGLSRRAVTSPANNTPSRQRQSVQRGSNAPSNSSSEGDNNRANSNNTSPRANPATSPSASVSTATRPASSPSSPATRPSPPSSVAHSQPLSGSDLREQLQAYAADLNLPQMQIDRLADSLRQRFYYDAVASADEVFVINQAQWQIQIRQETAIADLTAETLPDSVPLVYRQRVCWAQAPGPVKVGLVVRPDGSPQGEPAVLQSSGYGAVDERALKALMEKDFPAATTTKAYILTVDPALDYGRRPCINPNPEA